MKDTTHKPIDILIVEDNPADVRLAIEVLKEARLSHRLAVSRDGEEAIAYLHRSGKYRDAFRPHIVLLDLNMPRKDGREVLAELKSDESLRAIPVVVMSTSSSQADVAQSYELQANCYITKPTDFDEYVQVVKRIEQFWFDTATLPAE